MYDNSKSVNEWFANNAEQRRYEYNLTPNSVVIDLGGYKGEFADKIYKRYGCIVHVFEPIKSYYEIVLNTNKNNAKVIAHHKGLSGYLHGDIKISLDNDASSIHTLVENKKIETVKIELVDEVLFNSSGLGLKYIDLLKINIEGEEYDLIKALINYNCINKIKNIQVQFHTFIDDHENKRENLHKELQKTHHLTYNYPFVWENWRKNT